MVNRFADCVTIEELDIDLDSEITSLNDDYYIYGTITKAEFDYEHELIWSEYYERHEEIEPKELYTFDHIHFKSPDGTIWELSVNDLGDLVVEEEQ